MIPRSIFSRQGDAMNAKVGVVLGATRGIGLALAEALAGYWGGGGIVYLTARDDASGRSAVATLDARGVRAQHLLFDLADPEAASRVANRLRRDHGGVDVVVQNGAYMPRAGVPAVADARPMIEANSHGTLRVLQAFLPVLRAQARLVVVASSLGVLGKLPPALRTRFEAARDDPAAVNRLMDDYVAAVEAGDAQAQGWPDWVNIPSKVGQVALVRAFARWARTAGALPDGALVNAANPGVTFTDATRDFMGTIFKPEDAQTPEQAARSLLWLATLPSGTTAPQGELVEHRRVIPFGDEA
jgi:NAD(P)-dependent dehydrogenase (short-subunit alcohol dehydrogenase family)